MVALASPPPIPMRQGAYAALVKRNRLVGTLRWLVPAAGVALFAVVAGAMLLDNLAQSFGVARLRVDRDRLVVDTPELASVLDDGTRFELAAGEASAALANTTEVALRSARLTMRSPDLPAITAEAAEAMLDTQDQHLTVPGITEFQSEDGASGNAEGLETDFLARKASSGPVTASLADGSRLVADTMSYDHTARVWRFTGVTVTLPFTPGGEQ